MKKQKNGFVVFEIMIYGMGLVVFAYLLLKFVSPLFKSLPSTYQGTEIMSALQSAPSTTNEVKITLGSDEVIFERNKEKQNMWNVSNDSMTKHKDAIDFASQHMIEQFSISVSS